MTLVLFFLTVRMNQEHHFNPIHIKTLVHLLFSVIEREEPWYIEVTIDPSWLEMTQIHGQWRILQKFEFINNILHLLLNILKLHACVSFCLYRLV